MQAIFAQSLSYGGVMNTEASEACSSLDVVVGSFVTAWMSRRCALGVNFGRPAGHSWEGSPLFHVFAICG